MKNISITFDYEIGTINVIGEIFPKARCYFHYIQSLIWNEKKLLYKKKSFGGDYGIN